VTGFDIFIDAFPGEGLMLEQATGETDDERIGGIITGGVGGKPVSAQIQLEIDAPTRAAAVEQAYEACAALRKIAGLDPSHQGKAFVFERSTLVGLRPDDMLFFKMAEKVYDDGHYPLAVVAAQTACELYMEGAFDYALNLQKAGEALAQVVTSLLGGYSMMDKRMRAAWFALTGHAVTEPQPVWERYKEHVERRNRVVHAGEMPSQADAAVSLDASRGFCEAVADVLKRLSQQSSP
jgi:hypothetical protein